MAAPDFHDYCPSMNPTLRRILGLLLIAGFFSLFSTGCQTAKGFGKDVEKLGDKIEDKASK